MLCGICGRVRKHSLSPSIGPIVFVFLSPSISICVLLIFAHLKHLIIYIDASIAFECTSDVGNQFIKIHSPSFFLCANISMEIIGSLIKIDAVWYAHCYKSKKEKKSVTIKPFYDY